MEERNEVGGSQRPMGKDFLQPPGGQVFGHVPLAAYNHAKSGQSPIPDNLAVIA